MTETRELNLAALLQSRGRLLETHISWVILLDGLVYKIKKPVNFGFLDYSTLEKRHHYCLEEVRLNRRWAEALYLGVVPITGTSEHPQLEGGGPILDYAVKMVEFPQNSLYDVQLREGRLSSEQAVELAERVASFHRNAPRVGTESELGEPEHIQGPALDNFITLAKLEPNRSERLRPLAEWTTSSYEHLREVLRWRKQSGFVRELHGDLHTGNVAEWEGHPLPFDGIEFNDEFRCIDTLNDLAFLISDLDHHGRPDLGRRVLDVYLEETGDWEGLQLWRYYLLYRLMVRAKVAALRKTQHHPELDQEIDCYLSQAERLLKPAPPVLILTHGLSGSGKTFLTQRLVEDLGMLRLRSDVVRKVEAGLPALADSGSGLASGIYTSSQTDRTYNALARLAGILLRSGYSVVVDATFLRRSHRDQFRGLARELGLEALLISLEIPQEILRARIIERKSAQREASEATTEVLEHQLGYQEPLEADEPSLKLGPQLPTTGELVRLLGIL